MKQLFSALLILLSFWAHGQQNISNTSTIPVAVTDGFLKKFPNNTEPKWSPNTFTTPTATSVYVVEFKTTMSDRKNEAWVDKDGNIVRHTKMIEADELPEAVRANVAKTYPGFEFTNAEKIEEAGHTDYAFDIKKGQRTQRVRMDSEGTQK